MGEVKTRPITPNQFDEFVEENDLVKTPEDMVAIEVSDIALKVEREMKQEVREYNKDYVLEAPEDAISARSTVDGFEASLTGITHGFKEVIGLAKPATTSFSAEYDENVAHFRISTTFGDSARGRVTELEVMRADNEHGHSLNACNWTEKGSLSGHGSEELHEDLKETLSGMCPIR